MPKNQPSLIRKPDADDYLALPARDLLDAYGAGNHIPGSGSAAVLSSLVAIEMMRTVCKRTLAKKKYQDKKARLEHILTELDEKYKPRLHELFRQDIAIFNRVSIYRFQRDQAEKKSEKNHWDRLQLDELRNATEIPAEVCRISLEILPYSFFLFDQGYKAVRGDSGVAVSNLLSAVSGALFIIFLNLRSFRENSWVRSIRKSAEKLSAEFERAQKQAFERVLQLYEEGLPENQGQLAFDFFAQFQESDE